MNGRQLLGGDVEHTFDLDGRMMEDLMLTGVLLRRRGNGAVCFDVHHHAGIESAAAAEIQLTASLTFSLMGARPNGPSFESVVAC